MNNSTINASSTYYLGYSGSGNLTMNSSNVNVTGWMNVSDNDGSSANLIVNSGNLTVGGLRIDYNDTRIRLGGGSANVIANDRNMGATDHTWEHLVDRKTGRYDQMGLLYYSATSYIAKGNLKVGIKGGAVISSTNTFYLQASSTPGTLSYASTPSDMYDAPTAVTDIDTDNYDAVQIALSSGNQVASLDLDTGAYSYTLSGNAAGWASVANIDTSKQRQGINVLLKLGSGTVQDVLNKLTEAGYAAETTTFEDYDLKFKTDVSDLSTGTGYVIWDFRDISTGAVYATLDKIMVCPVVSGAGFYVH